MQPLTDIRPYKQRLRDDIKQRRRELEPEAKQTADSAILRRVLKLREYLQCRTLFTFVSTPIEVDTRELINRALADGKRVAVPRCVKGTRIMEFYYIDSIDSLEPGTFGVMEPPMDKSRLAGRRADLCIVPALSCDREGFRLGYGGGYYDRYLSQFSGVKICVLYEADVRDKLWHGRYDVPVDFIVTEKRLHFCSKRRPPREPFAPAPQPYTSRRPMRGRKR